MYETTAVPAPPPLSGDTGVAVDREELPSRPRIAGYDSANYVLPPAPPPGTVTYRLRATETAQDA